MSLNVIQNPNGVKIYNVNIGKAIPKFLTDKQKRKLRKDQEYQRRLDLIQDFEFPTACQKLNYSTDEQYIVACGVYSPQIRIFDLPQLCMKVERHIEVEVVNFKILSNDYSKLAILRMDRTIDFHAQFGFYHRIKIPKSGRDLLYHPLSCDLYVTASGSDVYRVNLEQGQFLSPLNTNFIDGVNANSLNPVHSLLCFGGDNGLIECWDPRTKNRVAVHDVQHSISIFNRSIEQTNCGINSLQFDKDGVTLGVGTTEGHCLLYDIRSSTPLIIKEHQYGDPIKKIMFQDKKVISIDNKIVKIWDRSESNGKVIANIEPTNDINDVILCPNSGLFLMATEQPKIMSYFIPELGPAPKWCAFLDNLTEELEENKQSIYDDYKFVTKEEIERLSLTKLIGTNYLRAYMHGYFMDLKLYNKLRAIADPFEFEDYRKAKIKEKIEKEQTARIGIKRNIPTVNVKTALRIMQNDKTGKSIMNDNRFADMFENPDFQIDENDDKYKMYHSSNSQPNGKNIMDHFDKIDSDEEEEEDQENDIDDQNGSIDFDDKEDEEEEEKLTKQTISKVPQTKQGQTNKQSKKIEFYELKSGHEAALRKGENITKNQQLTLGERLQQQRETSKPAAVKRNAFGALEMTFMPENKKRKDTSHKDEWVARLGERRSARDILPKVKLRSGPRSKKSKM